MRSRGFFPAVGLALIFSGNGLPAADGEHLPLAELAADYGFSLSMESAGVVSFCSDLHRLSFRTDSREMRFDGVLVHLNGPALHRSRWLVTADDVETVLEPLLSNEARHRAAPPLTVILDPGHGGEDSGAVGRGGILEKDLVLDIARCVRRRLRGCGAKVRLTRERDRALELDARTSLARDWGADAFVSIHLNAAASVGANGVETYVLPAAGYPSTSGGTNDKHAHPGNRYDRASILLACYVQKGILAATGADDRGVRRARYELLREAPCPAILVECGFVTNPADGANLARRHYRERIARGIAEGVLTFIGRAVETRAKAAP